MNSRVYPGMMNSQIEFFLSDDNLMFMQDGTVNPIVKLEKDKRKLFLKLIEDDTELKKELEQIYGDNENEKIERIIKCRYGGLDFKGDIIENKLQEAEHINCPIRSICESKGVICKTYSYKGQNFTDLEVKLWIWCTTEKTNHYIADKLEICYGTFHKLKQELYAKLNIQTKQGLTIHAFKAGII